MAVTVPVCQVLNTRILLRRVQPASQNFAWNTFVNNENGFAENLSATLPLSLLTLGCGGLYLSGNL